MSECKHKWKKEPYAGSIKCVKCGHVEFNVAGECLSLQAKVEEMQAAIAETVVDLRKNTWPSDLFTKPLEKFLPEKE